MADIPVFRSVVLTLVSLGLPACGQTTTAPSAGPRQDSSPTFDLSALLTGTVVAHTGQGTTPVAGARVFVTDLLDGPYGWQPWVELTTDASGRFSTTGMVRGRAVKIVAHADASRGLSQVCGVNPTLTERTDVDVELVGADVRPNMRSPTLSGVLFEVTPLGPKPAANVRVQYSTAGHDGADAYSRTGEDGRYAFCNLPTGAGLLYADCVDPASPSRLLQTSVEIRGDAVLDVDVTRVRSTCK